MKVENNNKSNYYNFETPKSKTKHTDEDPVVVIIKAIATILFTIGMLFVYSEELKAKLKSKNFTPNEKPSTQKTDTLFKKTIPFSYTLKLDGTPPAGPLKNFYNKFKSAEQTGKWHTVFDLPSNYTQEELKSARKKIIREIHSDKLQDNRDVADKVMAAFNALYKHLELTQ